MDKMKEVRRKETRTTTTWRVSWQTWLIFSLLGLTFWFFISYMDLLAELFGMFLGAILLSLAMRPLANSLERWHIPRGFTVLISYTALGGLLAIIGTLLVPVISMEFKQLQDNGPGIVRVYLAQIVNMPYIGQYIPTNEVLVQHVVQWLEALLSPAVSAIAGIGGLAVDVFIMLVLAYFFTTDTKIGPALLATWVPSHYQPHVRLIATRLHRQLTRWIWAQAAMAFYFALVFSVGLAVLRVPFAFSIGVVGGMLEVVPYVGGAIALLLAVFSALTVQPMLVLWVLLFYTVVVEIESHIMAPALFGRVIGLHPASVLVALFVGAKIAGIVGVFFAIPVTVIATAFLREVRIALYHPPSEEVPESDMPPV